MNDVLNICEQISEEIRLERKRYDTGDGDVQ